MSKKTKLTDKEKEIIKKVTDYIQYVPDEQKIYILGVVDTVGMLCRAEKAGQEADIHMKKENNPKEQTTVRLTVRIPDELEKQVRDEAERRGLSINQMMIQMVTRYLKDHQD